MNTEKPKFRIVLTKLLNAEDIIIDLSMVQSYLTLKKRDGLLTEAEANTVINDLKATFPAWDFTKRMVG